MKHGQKNKEIEKMLSSCKIEPKETLKAEIMRDAILENAKTAEKEQEKSGSFISFKRKWRYILAACCFVLVLSATTLFGLTKEEYLQIYVDVNPSISMAVNRFDKVVKVDCLNHDAKTLLEGHSFKGMKSEEATGKILNLLGNQGYFENGALFITTKCKNEKHGNTMQEKFTKDFEQIKNEKKYNVKIYKGGFSENEKDQAQEIGMSPVKYHMISRIIQLDSKYTVEELKNLNMKDLVELLQKLTIYKEFGKEPSRDDFENWFDRNYKDWFDKNYENWFGFPDSDKKKRWEYAPDFSKYFK